MRMGIFAAMVAALFPAAASAAVMVVVESKTVVSDPLLPVTGHVDVYLDTTSADTGLINSWQAVLHSTGIGIGGGVTLGTPTHTQPDRPTLFDATVDSPLPGDPNTPSHISGNNFGPAISLASADNLGLFRIPFTIAPGASGTIQLTLDTHPDLGTILSDPDGIAHAFTALPGTLTILPLPEPTLPLLALLTLPLLSTRRRMRDEGPGVRCQS